MRTANPYVAVFSICLIIVVTSLFVYSQTGLSSDLSIDQRIALVEKKIEGGAARGDIPRSEYSKLKTRLSVVKYKRAKIEKAGVTEQSYKDLDHYLFGLERDTDRWLAGQKGR